MNLFSAILLLFSIVSTDIAVHLLNFNDPMSCIIDKKAESENESENEKETESEKDKDIHDSNISKIGCRLGFESRKHYQSYSPFNNNFIEIHLPPPDLV